MISACEAGRVPCGFPQLDWITFRIVDPAEAAYLGVPLGTGLHSDTGSPQLRHHPVEIIDAEIDHPLLLAASKVCRIVSERREDCAARLLAPHRLRDVIYAQMLFVPSGERLR